MGKETGLAEAPEYSKEQLVAMWQASETRANEAEARAITAEALARQEGQRADAEKKRADELDRLAMRDLVTELYNERGLLDIAKKTLPEARETERRDGSRKGNKSLLLLDLDSFKQLNDRYGHPKVNELLADIGKYLESTFRKNDVIARLHGDEFAILFDGDEHDAYDKLYKNKLRFEKEIDGENVVVTFSGGVVNIEGKDLEKAKKQADKAMYKAKQTKDRVIRFAELEQ
jgi:diguanylate cyclase (GGDEF)-like protein